MPVDKYVTKQYEWELIRGRSARNFGKRVWKEKGNEIMFGKVQPVFTTYNGREVMVFEGYTYRKGEYRGSYTVTPEQLANRPKATIVKARANSPRYAPVHFKWNNEED